MLSQHYSMHLRTIARYRWVHQQGCIRLYCSFWSKFLHFRLKRISPTFETRCQICLSSDICNCIHFSRKDWSHHAQYVPDHHVHEWRYWLNFGHFRILLTSRTRWPNNLYYLFDFLRFIRRFCHVNDEMHSSWHGLTRDQWKLQRFGTTIPQRRHGWVEWRKVPILNN